jgi:hypothetical protein
MNLIDKSVALYFEPASIGSPDGTRCKGAMTMAAIEAEDWTRFSVEVLE